MSAQWGAQLPPLWEVPTQFSEGLKAGLRRSEEKPQDIWTSGIGVPQVTHPEEFCSFLL